LGPHGRDAIGEEDGRLESTTTGVRTALYEQHVAAGARMVEFAGYMLPIYYQSIVAEHNHVRNSAGLFDVSHMGEFLVSGPGALATIERLLTNRVSTLSPGGVRLSFMCYETGGVVDDLLVYRLDDGYMLVVNGSNRRKDFDWIKGRLEHGTEFIDVSDETALIAIQGPASEDVLAPIAGGDVSGMGYYRFDRMEAAGHTVLVSRTGYTGEDGFEVYSDTRQAPEIWSALMESGRGVGVRPAGLGARDTLRLEMGYCLYGNDIDQNRTPVEAGLMWITKLDKGDFVGRDAIRRMQEEGPAQRLVGFELIERGIPRQHQGIYSGGKRVGEVTSGTFSPSLEKGIGLGYLAADVSGDIEIDMRGRMVGARTTSLPFYREGSVKRRK
jgi:aminomethyltransferase